MQATVVNVSDGLNCSRGRLKYIPTKQYFQGWLKFFLGALLTLGVLSAMVTVGLKVMLAYGAGVLAQYAAAQALGSGGSGVAQTTMMQGGLGLMMCTLMITAPMLVNQMLGTSLGFTAYNAFTSTSMARDANGNLVGAQANQQSGSRENDPGVDNSRPISQALIGNTQSANNMNVVKHSGQPHRGAAS